MFDRRNEYGVSTSGRGVNNMSGVTLPHRQDDVFQGADEQGGDDDHPATAGNPLTFLFIILGTIVALFFVRKSSSVIQGETFGVNWFTFLQVTVMSIGGILLTKAIFGRFPVPGISNAVAAI